MPTRTQHTPLPWIQHIEGTHRQIFLWAEAPPLCVAMIKRDGPNTEQDLVNGDFIQEACNNYERLKASNAELVSALKRILDRSISNKEDAQLTVSIQSIARAALSQKGA